jgi:hypothetical protein
MRGGGGKLSEQENQRRRKARAHKGSSPGGLARSSFIEGLCRREFPTPLRFLWVDMEARLATVALAVWDFGP